MVLSDSDERGDYKFTLNSRPEAAGNFESDSLNENFSPTRPNAARRKRKFKRMAVEYEPIVTPSSSSAVAGINLFAGAMKQRVGVLKSGCQENFRANLFFCGKRKRSHRDYEHKQHSSSVPRQRDAFASRSSYLEYKSRNRIGFGKQYEKIQPLNSAILSKIEKISQDSRPPQDCQFMPIVVSNGEEENEGDDSIDSLDASSRTSVIPANPSSNNPLQMQTQSINLPGKSGSLESNFSFQEYGCSISGNSSIQGTTSVIPPIKERRSKESKRNHRRIQKNSQLQFDDPSFMDCNMEDFLSSSSISSSESEGGGQTCDSDGDDELTDWPGNEVMINFASKNDFKRARPQKQLFKPQITLPQIKSSDDQVGQQDDDTLMSGDDLHIMSNVQHQMPQPGFVQFNINHPNSRRPANAHQASLLAASRNVSSLPINIAHTIVSVRPQIESEMSGETSNHFLSSPNAPNEVREIRAGCRRVREERPSFSIITSVNEDLSRWV